MKKEKPAILKELSFREYILVLKYFMKQTRCPHVTGFVNHPLVSGNLSEAELEALAQSALKHGTLTQEGQNTEINHLVAAFLNYWLHSKQVVMLKKPSWQNERAIAFGRVENLYLVCSQNATKDRVLLLADSDPEILYEALKGEIEKKESGSFKLKNVNRIFLQCIENQSGKKLEADTLLYVGKKELEAICLDAHGVIASVKRAERDELKSCILDYIREYCPEDPSASVGDGSDGDKKDPEFYTKYSFVKLTRSEQFPKSFPALLKLQLLSVFRSFADWKKLLKGAGITLLLALGAMLWNLYALCYLNDTFDISRRALFGNATAYLLAGTATPKVVLGLPPFWQTVDTIFLTGGLYFLGAIALKGFFANLRPEKIKKSFSHLGTFRTSLKNYQTSSRKSMSVCLWGGLAFAAVLNLLLFNPFTVALLGVLLLLSCIKQEDGKLLPFLMIISSSLRYGKVMKGKKKEPRFGEYELKLLGLAIGLFVCSLFNAILWFALDFNFWIRLLLMLLLVIFAALKLGIVKVSRGTATAIFLLSILALQLAILLNGSGIPVLADDGGWSESGGTIAGLMQNMGWETILGFSLTLAAAVAVGCAVAGFGAAFIAGASLAAFGTAAAGSAFTKTGREAAYDFMWGKYSPYGGDSKLAGILKTGVSFVPVFGNAFGVISGVRDCSYDVREGDWAALAFDGIGVVGDTCGFIADWNRFMGPMDEMADTAGIIGKNADDAIADSGDDLLEKNAKNYVPGAGEDSDQILRDGDQWLDKENRKLKPNVTYQAGEHEYLYETNERGLISRAKTGDTDGLQWKTHESRLTHDTKSLGKLDGDDAGHLIADRFGGSPEVDNILSQLRESNRGSYKKLENEWANALKNNQNVQLDIRVYYAPDGVRPKSYYIRYWIDGMPSFVRIGN